MKKPSDVLKHGIETLPHRALILSSGVAVEDLASDKPFIGIANSFNTLTPGHVHLDALTREVARGIRDAGGVPFQWGVPGICDGISMHVEMRLSLPSREHIADNIEIMTLSHSLDGWVGVTNCDKITPGMLMAAGRINLPALMVTGGPMKANRVDGRKHHPIEGFGIVGRVKAGRLSRSEAEAMLPLLACGTGSCVGLYTANTMAVVTEVLGMSLSGSATTPAVDPGKSRQAYETGRLIVELVQKDIRPRDLMTEEAFENAIRVDMAMGGSTNTVLHIPSVAREVGIDIPVEQFDRISRETPNLCSIIPAGPHEMADIDEAGGVPALLSRIAAMLHDTQTCQGASIRTVAGRAAVRNNDVIRPLGQPHYEEGGIAVLKGNIANSAITKQTAVDRDMHVHSGPARVFHSEEDLLNAVEEKRIQEGDVIVLPYQGPAGAPGMPEMLMSTDAILGAGYRRVALITDGRFSGATSGPCIGHVEMEAHNGGAIGAIRDGDVIEIDLPARRLNVALDPEEIQRRLESTRPPSRSTTPLLRSFREKYGTINCYGK